MRILFCNIAWMDYYKGICMSDIPKGGGSYVDENIDAHEQFNFCASPFHFEENFKTDGEYCLGFVETKETFSGTRNQLHIEKIDGCELCVKDEFVEDVLVVYCATHPSHGFTAVVGWYQHATVYRKYMEVGFEQDDGSTYWQAYNAISEKENCVLLPRAERSQILKWKVPRKKDGISFGFGRANVWFAQEQSTNENLNRYLQVLKDRIQNYCGDNWIDSYRKD